MKISYNWLKEFLTLEWNAEKTAELLTDLGLEVEGIETIETVKGGLKGVVVGKIIDCKKHPNADKLKLTTVNIGEETSLQIVCGAPNVAIGQTVAVATIGTILYVENEKEFKIKKSKIRGEESFGMICSEEELGLGKSNDGIMVLDETLKAGTPIAQLFDIDTDEVFEIGLTPNRADAMSHYGVARDLRAGLLQQNIKLELISPSVSGFHIDDRTLKIAVEVEDKEKAPRYAGVTISDITVKESPKWMQNRLKSIGLTPVNNVVDATNYVLHELGQPLHAFDASKIKENKVIVKTLPKGTKFITLDGVERELYEEDLMICDGKSNPMCIAGVFGGLNSGVTENTTSIFLESAYFNSVSVRKTAKNHGLNTDASFRFERGVDINFVKYGLKRAANLILEVAGGKVSSEVIDLYPLKKKDKELFLSYKKMDKLIGEKLQREKIKNILSSLEIKVNSETDAGLGLIIPFYRVDVTREADVIEEILRIYGYNNIEFSHKIKSSIVFSEFNEVKIENTIANQLTALGFYETMANSLTKKEYTLATKEIEDVNNVAMLNPLSSDLGVMRQTLFFSGLESISHNVNRKNTSLKIFEFGKTYHKYNTEYKEQKHLSIFVTGNKNKERWNVKEQEVDFYYLKGIVFSILERLGIGSLKTSSATSDFLSEGIDLSLGKIKIAKLGTVKKTLLKSFGIKQQVFFANLNWQNVLQVIGNKTLKITDLSKFPSVKRDFALLIDEKVSFDEIYKLAHQTERKLLKEVDLFDVYKGSTLPKGKKSYAVSFLFQDESKTLTDKQVDKIMTKLQTSFEKNLGAVLR